MINLINKELFNVNTEKLSGEYGDYFKTTFASTIRTPRNNNKDEKIARTIGVITSSQEDYDAENIRITAVLTDDGKTITKINSSERNKYDSDVYLIAIPFNGMIEPIEFSHDYRIYRGFIVNEAKRVIELPENVLFPDNYKKVAYMIVAPNTAIFAEDHKYHKDVIKITLNTFNLENNGEKKETVKTTISISFLSNGGYQITNEKEVIDPIDSSKISGKKLFPLFTARRNNANDSSNDNHTQKNNAYSNNKSSENKSEELKCSNIDDMINKMNRNADYNNNRGKKEKKRKGRR